MVIRRACPLSRRRWWAITVAANVRPIRYRVRGPSRILLTVRSSYVVFRSDSTVWNLGGFFYASSRKLSELRSVERRQVVPTWSVRATFRFSGRVRPSAWGGPPPIDCSSTGPGRDAPVIVSFTTLGAAYFPY